MEGHKNRKNIYESVDDFFRRIIELKNSDLIKKYFQFLRRVPNHAPFNNTLAFMQNPDCSYYATADQWKKRFNRTVKEDVRPMVVLFPFAPVVFVYDYSDTEGNEVMPEQFIYWWRENGGALDNNIIRYTRENLEGLNIDYRKLDAKEYFAANKMTTGGYASSSKEGSNLDIVLHPKYSDKDIEAYGVLCHEMAHFLLGHLGEVKYYKRGDTTKLPLIISKDRRELSQHVKELEAELVAWIVFDGFGINKNSEAYMASWLINSNDLIGLKMSIVLTVASKIREMGKRRIYK